MRALVVDDSAVIRKLVCEVLDEEGFSCEEAENGLEGIKYTLREPFNLIVTDINMPGLDGLKFIQRIRASAKGRRVPVIVLSSRRDERAVLQARDLAVQGFVLKPVSPEALRDRVRIAMSAPVE